MGAYKYITNRALQGKAGNGAGKVRVLVKNDSDTAEVDYVCPECKKSEHINQPWRRPFSVKCSACGFLMRLPRLASEVKREKNLARLE